MAKQIIRELPKSLPHRDIYLDDLYEIEDILIAEYAALDPPEIIQFEYGVDDHIVMTTRQDLEEHGGSASNFYLNVVSSHADGYSDGWRVLWISGILEPTFKVPVQFRAKHYELFGRVEQIYKDRSRSLRTLARTAPSWPINALAFAGSMVYLFMAHPSPSEFILIMLPLYLLATVAPLLKLQIKDRIYFRHTRQDEKARREQRNKIIGNVLLVVLGVVLTVMGTMVLNHFTKK